MGKHTPEFERCVESVMESGKDKSSAFAICTASFKKAGKPILKSPLKKQVEEVLQKHPGHPDQKVHGHKGRGTSQNESASATKPSSNSPKIIEWEKSKATISKRNDGGHDVEYKGLKVEIKPHSLGGFMAHFRPPPIGGKKSNEITSMRLNGQDNLLQWAKSTLIEFSRNNLYDKD